MRGPMARLTTATVATIATSREMTRTVNHSGSRFGPPISGRVSITNIVTGVAALYFNYVGQPSQLVQALIYASLAITFISAGHYAVQVARMAH